MASIVANFSDVGLAFAPTAIRSRRADPPSVARAASDLQPLSCWAGSACRERVVHGGPRLRWLRTTSSRRGETLAAPRLAAVRSNSPFTRISGGPLTSVTVVGSISASRSTRAFRDYIRAVGLAQPRRWIRCARDCHRVPPSPSEGHPASVPRHRPSRTPTPHRTARTGGPPKKHEELAATGATRSRRQAGGHHRRSPRTPPRSNPAARHQNCRAASCCPPHHPRHHETARSPSTSCWRTRRHSDPATTVTFGPERGSPARTPLQRLSLRGCDLRRSGHRVIVPAEGVTLVL